MAVQDKSPCTSSVIHLSEQPPSVSWTHSTRTRQRKKPGLRSAGRAVCVRTPFRIIAVRRSLRDRRPPAPQNGGRNHESRAGRHEQDSCQNPASHVAMFRSRVKRNNFGGCRRVSSRSNESPEQRHDVVVEKPSPSRPTGFPLLNESARGIHDPALSAGGP